MPLLANQPKQEELPLAVSEELRSLLMDFTVNYLLDQPADLVEYACSYFQKLQEDKKKETDANVCEARSDQTSDEDLGFLRTARRRRSVYAEQLDPEDDNTPFPVHPKSSDQKHRIQSMMKHILIFKTLSPQQLDTLIQAMEEKKVTAGEFIIRQGEFGDYFYIIESGLYHVLVEKSGVTKIMAEFNNKGSFGELALMYSVPRAASVQAMSPGVLWSLDRLTFRRIVLNSAARKRHLYEDFINNVPILKPLTDFERMNLADALVSMHFSDGQTIIREGDLPDGMYFIEKGGATVWTERTPGKRTEVNRLSVGDYFGELALLTLKPRAASVSALGDTTVAFLDTEAFERLLGPCMEIMKRNMVGYESQLEEIVGSLDNFEFR